MALASVVVAAVSAYTAFGLALWFGAGWLVSLLLLPGVGTAILLGFLLVALLKDRPERASATPATDPDLVH